MVKRTRKEEKEFMDEVNLCLKRTRGIKQLMRRLETALKSLGKEDYNEIALATMQDLNDILKILIGTWDQWALGVSMELDILSQYKK